MAETMFGVSQSSLLLRPKIERFLCQGGSNSNSTYISSRAVGVQRGRLQLGLSKKTVTFLPLRVDQKCRVSSESKASDILSFDAATKKPTDIEPDTGGGSGGGFGGGGGGGGDNGGDNNRNEDEGRDEGDSNKNKKHMVLSMSQKLTLGYAVLVGVGGLMGYLKSGSQKSLLSGGISASILYYVYTQLPTNPLFASSLGFGFTGVFPFLVFINFGVSAALLAAMGSRFKKSGKIFPAGVISLVSLVMAGGYVHGIMRSAP